MSQNDRRFETQIEIAASPAEVWRALTEATELMRWFPPYAEVEPGIGGRIHMSWGDALSGDHRILGWDPERHLRTDWGGGPRATLAVDYFLEGRGGSTLLRLVHSGFGSEASWDDEFDSISRGWPYELRSLKDYLERHPGRDRQVACAHVPVSGSVEAAWARLVGPTGRFRPPAHPVAEGERFELGLPDGSTTLAALFWQRPGLDFAAALDALDGARLRLGLEKFGGRWEYWIWLESRTLPAAELERRLTGWRTGLEDGTQAA